MARGRRPRSMGAAWESQSCAACSGCALRRRGGVARRQETWTRSLLKIVPAVEPGPANQAPPPSARSSRPWPPWVVCCSPTSTLDPTPVHEKSSLCLAYHTRTPSWTRQSNFAFSPRRTEGGLLEALVAASGVQPIPERSPGTREQTPAHDTAQSRVRSAPRRRERSASDETVNRGDSAGG